MPQVRVSIANLAWQVRVDQTAQIFPFAILNAKKFAKGELFYKALGGGAMLTWAGKDYMEKRYGATDFERDEKTGCYDARFRADVDGGDLEQLFKFFTNFSGRLNDYEKRQTLDIMEELAGDEWGANGPLVDPEKVDWILPQYLQTVRQKVPTDGLGTSERATTEVPTRRLFRIFELRMSQALFDELRAREPIFRVLTEAEIKTTEGGAKKGMTEDGKVIADNIFIPE